jgi:hypothetical protein
MPAVPQVEVTRQAYLRTVVDDLQVDVEDELGHRRICVLGRLGGTLRPGKPCRAEAAHSADPRLMRVIELVQRSGPGFTCWHTDCYRLRGEAWQVAWSQATEITEE